MRHPPSLGQKQGKAGAPAVLRAQPFYTMPSDMSATDTPTTSAAPSAAAVPPVLPSALPPQDALQAQRNAWLWLVLAALTGLSIVGNVLLWGKLSAMQQHLAQGDIEDGE